MILRERSPTKGGGRWSHLGDFVVVRGDGADDGSCCLVDGNGAPHIGRWGSLGVELAAPTELLPLDALQCLHKRVSSTINNIDCASST